MYYAAILSGKSDGNKQQKKKNFRFTTVGLQSYQVPISQTRVHNKLKGTVCKLTLSMKHKEKLIRFNEL